MLRDNLCSQCQKPLIERRDRKVKFCSNNCHYEWVKAQRDKRICTVCKKHFIAPAHSPVVTCSRTCGGVIRRKRKTRICKHCNVVFERHVSTLRNKGFGQFCSKKCYNATIYAWIELTCAQCGAEFKRRKSHRKAKQVFCKPSCRIKWMRGGNHPSFRTGHRTTMDREEWLLLAEKIRIRDGRVCVRCGKTEKEQGFKMSVDHIIPLRLVLSWNEAGLTDVSPNNEANLMSLCKNCHGIKTAAEIRYLRGDAVGFWRELGGHEGIAVAMRLYGERPPGEARSTNPTADLLFKELREENQWRN